MKLAEICTIAYHAGKDDELQRCIDAIQDLPGAVPFITAMLYADPDANSRLAAVIAESGL